MKYEFSNTPFNAETSHYSRQITKVSGLILSMVLSCQIATATNLEPKDLLIYYAFPSSINLLFQGNAVAAAEFGQYDYVVFGEGLEKDSHADHDNLGEILDDPAMASTTAFGYIDLGVSTTNHSITEIKTRVDEWVATGADGIFFDDFGYDFLTSRDRQNEAVDYVHDTYGLSVVANAFRPEDAFGSQFDASFNPAQASTSLNSTDFYLFESHQIRLGQFQSETTWQAKANLLKGFEDNIGFKTLSITTNDAGDPFTDYDEAQFFYSWFSALMYGHEATGWGEFEFSASGPSNAKAPFRARPNVDAGTSFTTNSPHIGSISFTEWPPLKKISPDRLRV